MTNLRTAAQQALEALTSRDGDGWTRRFARDRAIEALEAALAQQAYTDDLDPRIKLYVGSRLGPPQPAEPQTTHSAECWRWHHGCAVAKIERENKA